VEDWLSTNEPSRFSREFKLELRRMEAGENVSVLARELGRFSQEHLSMA
jgi:transposase-like protein